MNEPDKKTLGLYNKYLVTQTDGSSEQGGKHEWCKYFVLDMTHDPHAVAALKAYAASCQGDYPLLASDLLLIIAKLFIVGPPGGDHIGVE